MTSWRNRFLPSQTSAAPQLVSHEQEKGERGDIVLSCNYHLQLGHFTMILDVIPQSIAELLFVFFSPILLKMLVTWVWGKG